MSSKPDKSVASKQAGFFQISLATMQRIAAEGSYADLLTYIAMCRGVDGGRTGRVCSHGVLSVSTRTGMEHRAVQHSFKWLAETNLIECVDSLIDPNSTKPLPVRYAWRINDGTLDLAIANYFVDRNRSGIDCDAPIMRIYSEVSVGKNTGRKQAIKDAILLFAILLQNQNYADFAGVDPLFMSRPYIEVDDELFDEELPRTNGLIVAFVPEGGWYTRWADFICNILGKDSLYEGEQRSDAIVRLWEAFFSLKRLGLIYEVRVLWNGNPLASSKSQAAEPIATHYIFNDSARRTESFIEPATNSLIRRQSGDEVKFAKGYGDTEDVDAVNSGVFRYLATNKAKTFMVGQVRVKYTAANAAMVRSRKVEEDRTLAAKANLDKIGMP